MSNKRAFEIWNEVLQKVCGCYADAVGNRPCDNGMLCDKCMTDEVQRIYKSKLKQE